MDSTNNSGIYRIRNIITNDCYVGQSVNCHKRKTAHLSDLNNDKHSNQILQRAYNKYGKDAFVFEILIYCQSEDLTICEQYCVDILNPHYNILKECVTSRAGIPLLESAKIFLRELNTGENHPQFGTHPSDETRAKQRASHLGVPLSKEHAQHIGEALKGHKNSKEQNEKASIIMTQVWAEKKINGTAGLVWEKRRQNGTDKHSPEAIEKMCAIKQEYYRKREAQGLPKQSPESIAKQKATRKANKEKKLLGGN